ncbi:MAG: hypothetical protein IJR47_02085 [Clostridia bacterium]|nr:hypothetical protein [Clostridia bacterium]
MKINFKLTKSDYWKYNHFSIFHVKNIRRIFIATPVIIFTLTIVAGLIFKRDMRDFWICLAVAIGLPAFYVLSIYFPMAKGVMRIPEDKLVEQSLEFNDEKEQIIHTFGEKSKKYNHDNVLQIKRTKTHIFVTLENFSAIIIPSGEGYGLDDVEAKLHSVLGK